MTPKTRSPRNGSHGAKQATGPSRLRPKSTRPCGCSTPLTGTQTTVADELLGTPTDAAIAFLAAHYAGLQGYANVVAIDPKTGRLYAAGAPTDAAEELRNFIEQHRDERNLYFSVNPTRRCLRKKATKADIGQVAYLHVDLDPRDSEDLQAEKRRLLQAVKGFPIAPATLIDSGGGVQAFWKLADLLDADRAEALNRRIAEQLGGDNCWNADRIMRLPGTVNFPDERKRAKGRVPCDARLLRQTGQGCTAGAFEGLSGSVRATKPGRKGQAHLTRVDVPQRFYDDVLALDADLRARWRGSTDGLTDTSGSGMDMSLVNLLVPRGFNDDEIAAIVRAFEHGSQREKTDQYIGRMLLKARADATCASSANVQLLRASDVEPRAIDWLWPHWLAAGKLHILAGSPSTGKTTLALALAAVVSNGGTWPDGTRMHDRGNVLIWSGEDDIDDTLVPRLLACGADLQRVFFVSAVMQGGQQRPFDPANDLPALAVQAREIGGVRLLIVDSVVSVVAGDAHRNNEVRRALQPLVDLATEHGAAVLGISHFTKGTKGQDPLERVNGSLAFGALARIVFATAVVPETGQWMFVRAKNNIGPSDGGFEYAVEEHTVCGKVATTRLVWGEALEGDARELIADAESEPDAKGKSAVDFWLHNLLTTNGEMNSKGVVAAGEAAGYSKRTIYNARKRLGISTRTTGFGAEKQAIWSLHHANIAGSP